MKKKITFRQIAAACGVVLLLGMYVVSLILAIFSKQGAADLLMASVYMTFFIPLLLYFFITLDKLAKRNRPEGMSYSELRKYNKRIKNGEDPEKIAKEIEEKYGIGEEEFDETEGKEVKEEVADAAEASEDSIETEVSETEKE